MRRKTRRNSIEENTNTLSGSSTESEDIVRARDDPRSLTLHVIADPGQSASIKASFQTLIGQLNSSLDVICVSERFKVFQINSSEHQVNKTIIPSLAVLLFFKDEFDFEKAVDNRGSNVQLSEKLFNQKLWKFHHNVDVSGKLISCETNRQDFYEYVPKYCQKNDQSLPSRANSEGKVYHFPLWGARKVHCGRQILRFTVFSSNCNWKDQINFYKLILRKDETAVRDDFCFFQISFNGNTVIQLGLKKLPVGVSPRPLISSILQFKVKNVGQLVPVLPNTCDPISELRWRTRDYDGNVVLFQIRPTHDLNLGSSFVKRIFTDHDSSLSSDGRKTPNKKRSKTPDPYFLHSSEIKSKSNPRMLVFGQSESTLKNKKSHLVQSNPDLSKSDLGDSFICPSLPEKMPLFEPTVYFQTNSQRSSMSSSTTSTSEYHTARGTPDNVAVKSKDTGKRPPKTKCRSPIPRPATEKHKGSSSNGHMLLSLTKEKGFYV